MNQCLVFWTQGVWVCIFWACSTLSKADGVDVFNGKNWAMGIVMSVY